MSDSFSSFKQSIKGDIFTPTDADYPQAISRWAVNAQANAKIVAFVKTPEDVAFAIAYARDNHLPIAIRGGGHSTNGASSTEGLVIDLSRHLNTVEIDPENKLAYVGGGAIWEQVDKASILHNLATVAGTVGHTGVGGLTLGGGVGHLSGEHGLVIDNLVKVTIVTANGSILTASETENSDLFWGIRGGGCNFGVVTQFVLKLHPQRRTVFSGHIKYPADALEQVIKLTDTWWPNIGPKETLMIALTLTTTSDGRMPLIIVPLFYNGSEAEGRSNFKPFFDLEHIADLTKEIPYEELNAPRNFGYGKCRLLKGISHNKPHLDSAKKVLDKLVSFTDSEIQTMVLLEYFPFKKIQSIPNGTCAFQRTKFNNAVAFLTWENNTPENLVSARRMAREFASIIAIGQQQYLGQVQRIYGNYDHYGPEEKDAVVDRDFDHYRPEEEHSLSVVEKNRAEGLFRENYPRLQELKKKYDPENIFNKWFAITPSATP